MSRTPGIWTYNESATGADLTNPDGNIVCGLSSHRELSPSPDDMKYIVALQKAYGVLKRLASSDAEQLFESDLLPRASRIVDEIERL